MCVPWEVGLRKVKILGSSTELFTEVKGGGGVLSLISYNAQAGI